MSGSQRQHEERTARRRRLRTQALILAGLAVAVYVGYLVYMFVQGTIGA